MKSRALSLVLSLLVAAVAGAQAPVPSPAEAALPPRYEVEIIVFANRELDPTEERFKQELDGFEGGAETLRDAPVFDDTNFGAAARTEPLQAPSDLLTPADPLAAQLAEALRVRPLKPEELKLNNEYRKLRAVSAYVPLVHAGWVQPGLPEADAQPFDLKVLGILNPSGTIRVHLERFLHITLDLTYRADGTAGTAPAVGDGLDELVAEPRYHLKATRSARSGELHYFDHPAFGVLVRVTPVPTQNAQGRRPAA
ncbi:MAG TPA: CsiV family protein [Gammaproteobacteria bacterium]|nr:CsiV family protein [Gammaproteobacteria bacterium]